jgi:uncharacterized protein (TIGR03435 family)
LVAVHRYLKIAIFVSLSPATLIKAAANTRQAVSSPVPFEVASIRPSSGDAHFSVYPELKHGTLRGINVTLKQLIAVAYGITEPRVIGPSWVKDGRFDIVAKFPPSVSDNSVKIPLQQLLADRFGLVIHHETKRMAAYELVIGREGSKMPLHSSSLRSSENLTQRRYAPGYPSLRMSATTDRLASVLSSFVDRPVIDKTGLADRYEIALSFSLPSSSLAEPVTEFAPPDLFTAIKEQLGLNLKPTRTGIDVVVIDHIDKTPTEN